MKISDINSRVRAALEDPDATYITDNYITGHAQQAYEKLFNKLYVSDSQFDENIIEIPAVAAGTPDLSQYQASGGPLAMLCTPTLIEWKLSGMDSAYYRLAAGPLDAVRDLLSPGLPLLDSWSYSRRTILLSKFSVPLDLRVTGAFLFDPLNGDSELEMEIQCNVVLVHMICKAIAAARGNDKWVQYHAAEADEAWDDVFIAKVKDQQSRTRRLGRMSRGRRGRATIAGPFAGTTSSSSSVTMQIIEYLTNAAIQAGLQSLLAECFGGAAGITISLPAAAQTLANTQFIIKKMDATALGAVIVQRSGGDTIDGTTTFPLTNQFQYVTLVPDPLNNVWNVVANN